WGLRRGIYMHADGHDRHEATEGHEKGSEYVEPAFQSMRADDWYEVTDVEAANLTRLTSSRGLP
ncbi:MAG: hypothetical protein K2H87_04585, partial [Duncaniella sp.]|nr:hypothetical protein [Duncaniella sp.]